MVEFDEGYEGLLCETSLKVEYRITIYIFRPLIEGNIYIVRRGSHNEGSDLEYTIVRRQGTSARGFIVSYMEIKWLIAFGYMYMLTPKPKAAKTGARWLRITRLPY